MNGEIVNFATAKFKIMGQSNILIGSLTTATHLRVSLLSNVERDFEWWWVINPLTPISDQDRISPYNITAISSRHVLRIKKKLWGLVDDPIPNSPN